MKQLKLLLAFVFACIACNSGRLTDTPNHSYDKPRSGINITKDSPKITTKKSGQQLQEEKIFGIKEQGAFKVYERLTGAGPQGYSGIPKIEIYDSLRTLLAQIELLSLQSLITENSVELSPRKDQGTMYNVILNENDDKKLNDPATNFQDSIPPSLLQVATKFEHDLVQCRFTIYSINEHIVFRSTSEVIYVDEKGKIFYRRKIQGNLNFANLTPNKKYLYLTSGGAINEDSKPYPSKFEVFDLIKNKIIYSYTAKTNEHLNGAYYSDNLGYLKVTTTTLHDTNHFLWKIIDIKTDKILTANLSNCIRDNKTPIMTDFWIGCYTYNGNDTIKYFYDKDLIHEELTEIDSI